MKLSDEIKDLGIQITEAEKIVEDKENGQKEETVSVSKDIHRRVRSSVTFRKSYGRYV